MLTLEMARRIAETAIAGPRSSDDRVIAVAVVDRGGHPLAMLREDIAPPLLAHIAEAKAKSCVVYGKPTRAIMEWADDTPNWFHGVSRVSQDRMGLPLIASKGGVIIRDHDGVLLGAVGVAGEAGDMDEALALQGIEAVGLVGQAG